MSDNYIDVYYHIVWPTKNRVPYINVEMEPVLYSYLSTLCSSMGICVFAINGMPDHLHLVSSVPPTLSLSKVIRDLKGKSAHTVNHMPGMNYFMAWQPGYG